VALGKRELLEPRRAAENKVSSVAMARTIYTCASLVKSIDKQQKRDITTLSSSRVIVLGHSFGALMVERALNATCLDPLMKDWSWLTKPGDGEKEKKTDEKKERIELPNPLPLDFVLFINSAAPSIYEKIMRDFLSAHQSALVHAHSTPAFAPIFVSLTSSAIGPPGMRIPRQTF
jgi:hypothetical protein